MTDRGLIISFPDQSESFVLGYDAGILDERMRHGSDPEIELYRIHAANEELVRRMCIAYGWTCEFDPCRDETGQSYDGFRLVTMRKTSTPPERANPHGLRVAK